MKSLLITALETVCPNQVYLQGTLAGDVAYPDTFITFWTNSSDDEQFYDNSENAATWYYSVVVYSNDPAQVPTKASAIRTALKAQDFIPQGRGHDMPSDRETHTGWVMDFIYQQRNNL